MRDFTYKELNTLMMDEILYLRDCSLRGSNKLFLKKIALNIIKYIDEHEELLRIRKERGEED
jgi:hypothetical protein